MKTTKINTTRKLNIKMYILLFFCDFTFCNILLKKTLMAMFVFFSVAIDLIVQHIQELLRPTKQSVKRFRHNSDSFVGRPHWSCILIYKYWDIFTIWWIGGYVVNQQYSAFISYLNEWNKSLSSFNNEIVQFSEIWVVCKKYILICVFESERERNTYEMNKKSLSMFFKRWRRKRG